MKNLRTLASLCIAFSGTLFAQTSTSDCDGSIQLCGGVYTELSAPQGSGNVFEFTGICNQNAESASLWYTFTVQEAGDLSFVLDPANDADDYDWGLFNITDGGCAGINAQNGSSPEVECNSYGVIGTNGPTGISTANGGTGSTNGPGDLNGPAFNADLPVTVGQTYALVVMNWSGSPDGYNIDFTQSTAAIYDNVPPVPVSVTTDCSNQSFVVNFSEPIVTSTVIPTDFTLTSPSGVVLPFGTVTPNVPGAVSQSGYTITLDDVPMEGGIYTLTITSTSGNVEDPCGNIVVETTFEVPIIAPFSYTVEVTSACNGMGGTLQAVHVSGGTAPVTFTLGGTVLPDGTASGLWAGDYVLHVDDAAGCNILAEVTIPDHVIQVLIPQEQDSLSCSITSITVEGVQVLPEQAVNYVWTAVTASGTDPAFSSEASPTISQPGTYTVLVTDLEDGCTDQASVVIAETSVPTVDLSSITLPNVVSPNGDGMNDVWRPFLPADPDMDVTALFDTYELTVYDRWGQTVFDAGSGGKGSWNAKDVADGTYFYKVAYRAECGAVIDKEANGTITVLR
ncbi:MAG: gliding motility-associated C-terminal domain-containing protein [Flavobacteriales bacterium]|nr:gliding motility-associated C-terminal domain-containing protein [Flavobacteriales bacterium]MBK7247523.1 gliding motility-associated C-terminal domain-containing protein [Flavobacteriales bacterium]MBK9061238.1 gliding motility-associated C-terminal domain-containing protein [Flavobacteriales bacterium]MBK9596889.1 gliding motility-associated C-terminal domain-containing protein [Flavobacteriales bacterium]QQS72812.1 MAG: gliding motility-associated C-terminal domain-containing protein [Fla